MNLALLGEKLSHSLSPIIHKMVFDTLKIDGKYDLCEIKKEDLDGFMLELKKSGLDGINVTIPYKTDVMKSLDYISKDAEKIGAVNTIKVDDNKLFGFNTDYYGFGEMLKHNFIDVKDNNFVVIGAGGAAKGVVAYLADNGAKSIELFTRDKKRAEENFKLKEECDFKIKSYDMLSLKGKILINTTPVGMHPDINNSPIPSDLLDGCLAVVDLIYNPEKTKLLKYAEEKGIQAVNGFYMLVAQALKAQEIWQKREISNNLTRNIFNTLKPGGKGNLILIGMPGCGKSTIGKMIAEKLDMTLFDMDEYIEDNIGPIACLFRKGESFFRDYESNTVKIAASNNNSIICTGGGVIKRKENMTFHANSGTIVFIDRPLDVIIEDIDHDSRPLLDGEKESVIMLYNERIDLYKKYSHAAVINDKDILSAVTKLEMIWKGRE
jgi:shikimate dehydrogenase